MMGPMGNAPPHSRGYRNSATISSQPTVYQRQPDPVPQFKGPIITVFVGKYLKINCPTINNGWWRLNQKRQTPNLFKNMLNKILYQTAGGAIVNKSVSIFVKKLNI